MQIMFFRNKVFLPLTVLLLVGLGTISITALVPRDISVELHSEADAQADRSLADHVSRGLTGIILFLCLIIIIRSGAYEHDSRASGELGIWFFYGMFFTLAFVFPSMFGEVPSFKIQLLYAPFVFFAMYRAPKISMERLIVITKIVLFAFAYGSLLAVFLAPEKTISGNYNSFLPGVDFRLFGIASHPNALALVTTAALGMELISPSRWAIMRILNLLVGLLVLILAQSKTMWACAVLIGCYFLVLKIRQLLRGEKEFHIYWRGFAFYIFIIAIIIGVAGNFIDLSDYERSDELTTLTGRKIIWNITLDLWKKNPWFGYGLELWSPDFRLSYGLPAAGQAHNQFVQMLGMSGVAGLAGLMVYLGALYLAAVRVARKTPIPFLLLTILLMSCMSETPLKNTNVFSEAFTLHLLLFVYILQALKQFEAPADGDIQDVGLEVYKTQIYRPPTQTQTNTNISGQ